MPNRLDEIEQNDGEYSNYSRHDKNFSNLLEVIGTPHLNIDDEETILTTKHKRGIFAEI